MDAAEITLPSAVRTEPSAMTIEPSARILGVSSVGWFGFGGPISAVGVTVAMSFDRGIMFPRTVAWSGARLDCTVGAHPSAAAGLYPAAAHTDGSSMKASSVRQPAKGSSEAFPLAARSGPGAANQVPAVAAAGAAAAIASAGGDAEELTG